MPSYLPFLPLERNDVYPATSAYRNNHSALLILLHLSTVKIIGGNRALAAATFVRTRIRTTKYQNFHQLSLNFTELASFWILQRPMILTNPSNWNWKLRHHPDRGGDEAQFKDISKAYEVEIVKSGVIFDKTRDSDAALRTDRCCQIPKSGRSMMLMEKQVWCQRSCPW